MTDRLYELRIYDVAVGAPPRFAEVLRQHQSIIARHAAMHAVWKPETGCLTQLYSLWSYPSLSARQVQRGALQSDPAWIEAIAGPLRPLIIAQWMVLLRGDAPWIELADGDAGRPFLLDRDAGAPRAGSDLAWRAAPAMAAGDATWLISRFPDWQGLERGLADDRRGDPTVLQLLLGGEA